jgi:hypothetical protein
MPVNMDPKKRLRKPAANRPTDAPADSDQTPAPPKDLGEETPADKEKALADAEWKNLWDATEVIDMDKC